MTRLYVDGPTLIRAVAAATANLEAHVHEVDALNVFPVPDGDTGSNMLATMRAALAEAERLPEDGRDLHSVAEALSRGALTGARGNSGVILSQIIRGMTHGADGRRRANGLDLAQGLRKGSEVAYGAVLTPVEGTMLTVIRDAAEAAETAAGRQPHVEAVLADVIEAAASSVQRTPSLLPVLEDAGVVDSGGQGLYRVLEGMLQVGSAGPRPASPAPARPASATETQPHHAHAAGDHGYETEYVLSSGEAAIDVAALRAAIDAVGDSAVVAGDERLARVHVHGERPDLAIAAGLHFGRLSDVAIRDLDEQVSQRTSPAARGEPARGVADGWPHEARVVADGWPHAPHGAAERPEAARGRPDAPIGPDGIRAAPGIAVVAATSAPGLADVLASLGARIVRPAHGTRPSVGELAAAVMAAGRREVIVLPNDRDAVLAARQAAALTAPLTVRVIPTRNAAEGIAAAVVFDATASLDENVERMAAESAQLRSFIVTTAARDSVVDGRAVRQGQVIALDAARHLLAAGEEVEEVALRALSQLGDLELVTVYAGDREGPQRSLALRERIEQAGWAVEVDVVRGGQRHEHLLVAVE